MNKTQYFLYLIEDLSNLKNNRRSVSVSIAIVFMILAWGSNFTVCYCVLKTKKLHTLTNFFLVFISMADLVHDVVVMPLWLDVLIWGKMNFSHLGCQVSGLVSIFCDTGKVLFIYMISTNRLINVYLPKVYALLYRKWVSITMVTITWVMTLVIVVVTIVVGKATFVFHPGRAVCILAYGNLNTTQTIEVTRFVFCAMVPLCINIVYHVKAYKELKEHKRETRGKIRTQVFCITDIVREEKEATDKDEIQATRTLLGVVYTFSLCNILTTSITMADAYKPYFLNRGTHVALTFFSFLNSIINPFIFSRTCKAFRDVYVELYGCRWSRRVIHVQ